MRWRRAMSVSYQDYLDTPIHIISRDLEMIDLEQEILYTSPNIKQ